MSDTIDEAKELEAFQVWHRRTSLPWRDAEPRYAWLARARIAAEEQAALVGFANRIIDEMQLNVEGVQDIAVEFGLLKPVEVAEPCGENCVCQSEGYGFPCKCYRKTEVLQP